MWSASQNCSSLTNSFHIYEWADSPPDGAVQSMPACVFFSSVCVCVCCRCVHCIQAVPEQRWRNHQTASEGEPSMSCTSLYFFYWMTAATHFSPFLIFCLVVFQGVQQKRPSPAQNAILRRYFLELTQSFIIPLVANNDSFLIIISVCFSGCSHDDTVLLVCPSVTFLIIYDRSRADDVFIMSSWGLETKYSFIIYDINPMLRNTALNQVFPVFSQWIDLK